MHWILLLTFSSWAAHAHQTSVTSGGRQLLWPISTVPIQIKTNTSDLDSTSIRSIILSSMSEWNSAGNASVTSVNSSNNQIVFSSDFSMYGSAVIGLTEISYNTSGVINRAVIKLNDNYNFTNDPSSFGGGSIFLGDVVTHELGHLFGLSHSEVLNASMFYTSFPGQSSISADDKSGFRTKYGGSSGTITGSVQGGNKVGVLGAHVQAISRNTGEAIGVITNEQGYFSIAGLEANDSYYLYVSPLKHLESLPGYFANVQTEFCPGAYVGSFFSACGRESEGIPQPISITSNGDVVDIGVVTINCGLKANEDYSYQKVQEVFSPVTIWSEEEDTIREKAFVGFFRKRTDTTLSSWEMLKLDLTGIPVTAGQYLKVRLLGRPFGNLLQYEMRITKNNILIDSATIGYDSVTGTWLPDLEINLALSTTSSNNYFDVEIRAQSLPSNRIPYTIPSSSQFGSDSQMPYLLMIGFWDVSGPLFNTSSFLSDNESCLDAPFTFKVGKARNIAEGALTAGDSNAETSAVAGCGTIEPPDGGGPTSSLPLLVSGFALALLAGALGKKSKNFLS